jgi:hypothetical protein
VRPSSAEDASGDIPERWPTRLTFWPRRSSPRLPYAQGIDGRRRACRITRLAAILWGVAVGVFVLQHVGARSDTRLPADETARQLEEQLGVAWAFSCTRAEGDESIPAEIDYFCQPSRADEVGYFVDTDRTSIEIVSATG